MGDSRKAAAEHEDEEQRRWVISHNVTVAIQTGHASGQISDK